MTRESYPHPQQSRPQLESVEVIVAVILMAVSWLGWYVAHEYFYLEKKQIAELACYLAMGGLTVIGSAILITTARSRREGKWPGVHPKSETRK